MTKLTKEGLKENLTQYHNLYTLSALVNGMSIVRRIVMVDKI